MHIDLHKMQSLWLLALHLVLKMRSTPFKNLSPSIICSSLCVQAQLQQEKHYAFSHACRARNRSSATNKGKSVQIGLNKKYCTLKRQIHNHKQEDRENSATPPAGYAVHEELTQMKTTCTQFKCVYIYTYIYIYIYIYTYQECKCILNECVYTK